MDDCGEQPEHRVEIIFLLSLSPSEPEDYNCKIAARNDTIYKTYAAHYLGSLNLTVLVAMHGNSVYYDPENKDKYSILSLKPGLILLFYHIIMHHSTQDKRKQCYEIPI